VADKELYELNDALDNYIYGNGTDFSLAGRLFTAKRVQSAVSGGEFEFGHLVLDALFDKKGMTGIKIKLPDLTNGQAFVDSFTAAVLN